MTYKYFRKETVDLEEEPDGEYIDMETVGHRDDRGRPGGDEKVEHIYMNDGIEENREGDVTITEEKGNNEQGQGEGVVHGGQLQDVENGAKQDKNAGVEEGYPESVEEEVRGIEIPDGGVDESGEDYRFVINIIKLVLYFL